MTTLASLKSLNQVSTYEIFHYVKELRLILEFFAGDAGACDEVRIMLKVMGRNAHAEDCLSALNLTNWNIHQAIKLVKLKQLIKADTISDEEMLVALESEAWEVAKAASLIMKRF